MKLQKVNNHLKGILSISEGSDKEDCGEELRSDSERSENEDSTESDHRFIDESDQKNDFLHHALHEKLQADADLHFLKL